MVRRYTVNFGLVATVRPPTLNAQGFLNSGSEAWAMALRAAAALRSNSSRMRAVLSRASNLGGGPPGGMMSSSSRVRAFTAHAGSSATNVASRPSVIDLGCGFQEDLPSGTRSSTRRVAATSSSNSGISHSASDMPGLRHGSRALEVLEEQSVDAILTDLQMPVMDGLTLLSHLVERGVRVPVAVMTGQQITPEIADRLHRYGIAASFTKPVDLGTLAQELQRAVSPATVGRIAGITLFGFLQLIEVERKTARLGGHWRTGGGGLFLDRGRLAPVGAPGGRGWGAVYDILGGPDPRRKIFTGGPCRERPGGEPLQHVLREAARLQDERA